MNRNVNISGLEGMIPTSVPATESVPSPEPEGLLYENKAATSNLE